MRLIYMPLCMAALMLCGCEENARSADANDERNPLVNTGQSYMEVKQWDKAEKAFKQAIENNPSIARPHLDLAIIYHQQGKLDIDFVKAIYHYDRYLELRPDSEKAIMINEQKLKAARALAVIFINSSPEVKALVGERDQLKRENSVLQSQLSELRKPEVPVVVAETQPSPDAIKSIPETVSKASAVGAEVTHQIYTVVSGDNLTKIAKKFYGNDNYEPIYEANKDRMKSPGDLRVGQTLVVPNQ